MEKDTVDSTPAIVAIDMDSTDFVGLIESHSILDSSNVSTNPYFLDFLGQRNQSNYLLRGINEIDHELRKYDDFEGINQAPIGGEIIVYSQSIINAYFLLSHEFNLWDPPFM